MADLALGPRPYYINHFIAYYLNVWVSKVAEKCLMQGSNKITTKMLNISAFEYFWKHDTLQFGGHSDLQIVTMLGKSNQIIMEYFL